MLIKLIATGVFVVIHTTKLGGVKVSSLSVMDIVILLEYKSQ
jgi:hypothetical protein